MSDPVALEHRLRGELRGCRLVCEIPLDDVTTADLVAAMTVLRDRRVDSRTLRLQYPAITVVYLVAQGIFRYDGGTFWPNLSVKGLERIELGPAFEGALRRLELESFSWLIEEGALRYLTPILAHGGIPKYCLDDFFRLLLEELRRGATDAGEVLTRWKSARSRLANVDRPVERFLLFGGDTSLDLLDRCIDMVRDTAVARELPDPLQFGLPAYLCDAYAHLEPELKRAASSRLGVVLPRPRITLDPWSATGPALTLPGLTGDYLRGSWTLSGGGNVTRYRAGREDRIVTLAPAKTWSVDFVREQGELVRSFTFPGLEKCDALLFDYGDGDLIQSSDRLRSGTVWVLAQAGPDGQPRDGANANLLPILAEAPAPVGPWSGYRLGAYDVRGVAQLTLGEGEGRRNLSIRVRQTSFNLIGTPVPGVSVESSGAPVYSIPPQLAPPLRVDSPGIDRWRARLECNGQVQQLEGAAVSRLGESLASLLPQDGAAEVRLTLRGPLGADFRTDFAVVPDLEVIRPNSLSVPGAGTSELVVRARGYAERVTVQPGTDMVSFPARRAAGSLALRVTIPCLQWTVLTAEGGGGGLGQIVCPLSTSTLLEDGQALLVIRTRSPGLPLRLELRNGAQCLQEWHAEAMGEEGRWTFDLRRFGDTVHSCFEPELTIRVVVGSYDVHLVTIRSEVEIANMRSHQRLVPGSTTLHVTFDEARPLRGRVLRLWSLSQPWLPALVEPIPDDRSGEAIIERAPEDLPPGMYLAHIEIDNGWSILSRPRDQAPGVLALRLGTPADERYWVSHLPVTDAHRVLTKAYLYGELSRHAVPAMVREVGYATFVALATLAEHRDEWQDGDASSRAIVAFLILDLAAAVANGVDVVAERRLTPAQLLVAALPLLPVLIEHAGEWRAPDVTDQLWEICPSWAAVLQILDHTCGTWARLNRHLGVEPLHALKQSLYPNVKEVLPFLQMPAEQLEQIRRSAKLVPTEVLGPDNRPYVQFEWLLAHKHKKFSASDWARTHQGLADHLPPLQKTLTTRFVAIRPTDHQIASLGRIVDFPAVAFAAALHTVSGGPRAWEAVGALQAIAPACPGIVNRSVSLSTTLVHWGQQPSIGKST